MNLSIEDEDYSSNRDSLNAVNSDSTSTDSTTERSVPSVVEPDNHGMNNRVKTLSEDPIVLEEERLRAYARLLDSAIRLPGGFRIGLDGIVGLIPGIGDIMGAGLSGYLIYGASRLDIPRSVVARMIINTLIETVIGAIPVFGDVFDFIFKANDRNAKLLHAALEKRNRERNNKSAGQR